MTSSTLKLECIPNLRDGLNMAVTDGLKWAALKPGTPVPIYVPDAVAALCHPVIVLGTCTVPVYEVNAYLFSMHHYTVSDMYQYLKKFRGPLVTLVYFVTTTKDIEDVG